MKRPPSPHLVLAAAVLLPGCGHVLAGHPQRGLGFLMFTLMLGTVTWHLSTPETSLIGRWAGGLFIYALSIPDAYRIARVNYERWRRSSEAPRAAGAP